MIPERKNPYEDLIQQFLQNTQQLAGANEQRFQGQREERLIGEERDFQVERQEIGFARQDAQRAEDFEREDLVDARRREQAFTDAAINLRNQEIQTLRSALSLLDPDSPEFQRGMDILNAMSTATLPEGRAAVDFVSAGVYTLSDGTKFNSHFEMSDYAARARGVESDEAVLDAMRTARLEWMGDGSIPEETRVAYFDDIVRDSPHYSDEMKRAMLEQIRITDPEAVRGILLGNNTAEANLGLIAAQTAGVKASTAATLYGLRRDQRFEELDRQVVEAELAERVASGELREAEVFMTFGFLPTDPARRLAMVNRTPGVDSVEELEALGESRWQGVIRREKLDENLNRASLALTGSQVDLNRVAALSEELKYNRDLVYGLVREQTELSELALAAARNGDVGTLRMLEGLSTNPEYEETLQGINFASLQDLAMQYLGDEASALEYEMANRDLLLRAANRGDAVEILSFAETAAANFSTSDFTADADGNNPALERDVDAFLRGLTVEALDALGGREVAKNAIIANARRNHVLQGRGEAAAAMDLLMGTIPLPERGEDGAINNTREQRTWRSTFIATGLKAGMDEAALESIADGLLSGENFDFYKAMLDADQVLSQINLNNAYARRANLETDMLEAAEAAEPVVLTSEQYSDNLNGLKARQAALEAQLTSAVCTTTAPAGGQWITRENEAMCRGIFDEFNQVILDIERLRESYNTQTPWALIATNDPILGDERKLEIEAWGAMSEFGDGANQSGLQDLMNAGSSRTNLIMAGLRNGDFANVDELNEAISEALMELDAYEAQVAQEERSIHRVSESEGWRDLSPQERLGQVARTPEWQDLVRRVAGGAELTSEEIEEQARLFGFVSRMGPVLSVSDAVLGTIMPWRDRGAPIDRRGFEDAITQSVQAFNRATSEQNAPVTPGTDSSRLLTPQGTASPALMEALLVQESGNQHFRPDGTLKVSPEGAIGASQIMPFTAWRPNSSIRPLVTLPAEENAEMQRLYNIETQQTSVMTANRAGMQAGDPEKVAAYEAAETARREARLAATEVLRPFIEQQAGEDAFRRFGQDYLNWLIQRYNGDVERALAAYNAGPGNVDGVLAAGGSDWLSRLPEETRNYVPNIMSAALRGTR